jgi:hypothetical protein
MLYCMRLNYMTTTNNKYKWNHQQESKIRTKT